MDTALPAEVRALAGAAVSRLAALGGVSLARAAEADPAGRERAGAAVAGLADGLDVRGGLDQLLAGAVLCRAAGAVVLPWPVVPDLLRRDGCFLAVIDPAAVRVDHGGLGAGWLGMDLRGQAWRLHAFGRATGRLGPFAVAAQTSDAAVVAADDLARHLVLGSWVILGALEAALAEVTAHLRTRRQFGRALAEFQAIRFAAADAAVAVRGLEELAKFSTWQLTAAEPARRRAGALALRLHAAEVAVAVLRSCHQFYGATGFCDETDLSVIDRHLQPAIRYPCGAERLAQELIPVARLLS